ncbi:hypothetical protein SESBI_11204 [Sesbania bispinosa]|nr:hypothetical protein SESBI_11204 [Sesbania bispinosa]
MPMASDYEFCNHGDEFLSSEPHLGLLVVTFYFDARCSSDGWEERGGLLQQRWVGEEERVVAAAMGGWWWWRE